MLLVRIFILIEWQFLQSTVHSLLQYYKGGFLIGYHNDDLNIFWFLLFRTDLVVWPLILRTMNTFWFLFNTFVNFVVVLSELLSIFDSYLNSNSLFAYSNPILLFQIFQNMKQYPHSDSGVDPPFWVTQFLIIWFTFFLNPDIKYSLSINSIVLFALNCPFW